MAKTNRKHTIELPDAERRVRQSSKIGRVIHTLELIQGHGRWNAEAIAKENGCKVRTTYRDLDALGMAGVPYYFDKATGGYRVQPWFNFPTMNLSPDELLDQSTATVVAEAHGLQLRGAKVATQKLTAATQEADAELLDLAQQVTSVLDLKLADHSRHQQMIRTVQWAMLKGKQLKGTYATPYKEKPVKLALHPYRLCLAGQSWYLIARPHDGDHPKTYRVPRFQTLQMLDRAADVPQDFDLRSYFGNAWTVFRGATTYQVEIEFSKEAAPLVTETNWHHTQTMKKQHKDGRIVLAFEIDGLDEIVWWVLGWSGRAKVLAPVALRERVVEHLEWALALNRT